MRNLLNFEIQIYKLIGSYFSTGDIKACDISFKTRFIFRDGTEYFSPVHFCDELKKREVCSVSIIRDPAYPTLPESAFEFYKICFLKTEFKKKISTWEIETAWYKNAWYITYLEKHHDLFSKETGTNGSVDECLKDLEHALKESIAFCKSIRYEKFSNDLIHALELINRETDSDTALSAALSACVFSGMGSWNDEVAAICYDNNISQYNRVTDDLYNAIIDLICSICSFEI